jgi:hypothetical protein
MPLPVIPRRTAVAMLLTALGGAPAFSQGTPGAASGPMNHNDTRVHPGFTMTSLIPATRR